MLFFFVLSETLVTWGKWPSLKLDSLLAWPGSPEPLYKPHGEQGGHGTVQSGHISLTVQPTLISQAESPTTLHLPFLEENRKQLFIHPYLS